MQRLHRVEQVIEQASEEQVQRHLLFLSKDPVVSKNSFAPQSTLTAVSQTPDNDHRGQMAVFIARALVAPEGDAAIPEGPLEPTFPDVTSDNEWSWCYDHVEFIAEKSVTQGYFDGLYHPEYFCARDQMAVYICRAFDLPM